jgi:putative transposase
MVSLSRVNVAGMILTYCYRLLPTKRQHRALEEILEGQRQLYNAALEERIDAYRKAGVTRTYVDQCRALTEWRRSDPEAACFPLCLQRWTLKQLDEAYRGFFRRIKAGGEPGFPRFRGKGRFVSFGFREFSGIRFQNGRLRFKGMPGGLRVHLHRPLPQATPIRACVFRRDAKGWMAGFAVEVPAASPRPGARAVGVDELRDGPSGGFGRRTALSRARLGVREAGARRA